MVVAEVTGLLAGVVVAFFVRRASSTFRLSPTAGVLPSGMDTKSTLTFPEAGGREKAKVKFKLGKLEVELDSESSAKIVQYGLVIICGAIAFAIVFVSVAYGLSVLGQKSL